MRRVAVVLALAACGRAPAPAAPTPACAPRDEAAVIKAVEAMYAALKTDDLAGFQAVTTNDFYAFERGERMDGVALPTAIAQAHASGRLFVWNVTKPQVHIDCRLATITFVNEGSMGDAQTMQPRSWVESASLVYEGNLWRLQFFHSTRVEAK